MRKFSYYLYGDCDPKQIKRCADNPRHFFHAQTDDLLSDVVCVPPGECGYHALCVAHSAELVDGLIQIGLLKKQTDSVVLDSTVLLHEDLKTLTESFSKQISKIADCLEQNKQSFYQIAEQLDNGFSPSINLYHMLCGRVFDGLFFDYLSSNQVVSTSRMHASGLDYLIIVYENTSDLDAFSKKLLCSYNRFTDGLRSLQSFGDADGNRVDFFRFSIQNALNTVPAPLAELKEIWNGMHGGDNKNFLLDEMQRLVETGQCAEPCMQLLSFFGYVRDGKIVVPIYHKKQLPIINEMGLLAKKLLYKEMVDTLANAGTHAALICGKHGVSPGEIANELYHIVFGQLNEALVERGIVCKPPFYPGQGRYLQAIELM